MELPKVEKSEIQAGLMYLWRMTDGEIRPVWLNENNPDHLDEWDHDEWDLDALTGEFFGPVTLAT